MNLLQYIINFLISLKFWEIVDPDEQGVHLRAGNVHSVHNSGFFWQLPIIDSIIKIVVSEQVIDLPNQTLTSADGLTVNVSGTIRYEILRPIKTLFAVHDYDEALPTLAMEVIGEHFFEHEFTPSNSVLKECVIEALEKKAEDWGILILSVGITDKAKALAIRLYE